MSLWQEYSTLSRKDILEKANICSYDDIPEVRTISLHINFKEAIGDVRQLATPISFLELIGGQRPTIVKAKKSVSEFDLRKGMTIGAKATLRSFLCQEFYLQWLNTVYIGLCSDVVRPTQRIPKAIRALDGLFNYNIGIRNCFVFNHIQHEFFKFEYLRGLNITVATSSLLKEHSYLLFSSLRMVLSNTAPR